MSTRGTCQSPVDVQFALDGLARAWYASCMADRSRIPGKHPRDFNQRSASTVAGATGDEPDHGMEIVEIPEPTAEERHAAAVALGRLGGKKGGPARAKNLTAAQRSESARKAAQARWSKRNSDP